MDEKNINSELNDTETISNDGETLEDVDSPNDVCADIEDCTQSLEDSTEDTDTLNHEQKTKKNLLSILEYIEIFGVAVFAVLLIFSFAFRVCVVDGDSMNNTLQSGEKLLTRDIFYSPECGDIIVFYENEPLNKPLVKRVVATGGQTVEIDYNAGTVKVDGVVLVEDYVYLNTGKLEYGIMYQNPDFDKDTRIFKTQVPDGHLFVMGDNRNDSWDSRSSDIGCISEQQIMGKVICRISPFTAFD